jgi:hypothetical protein
MVGCDLGCDLRRTFRRALAIRTFRIFGRDTMEWDPAVRAKLKKLRELREPAHIRREQRTASFQAVSQTMSPEIKMVVGEWYTDELGNRARIIYNTKTTDVEPPYDLARAVTPA